VLLLWKKTRRYFGITIKANLYEKEYSLKDRYYPYFDFILFLSIFFDLISLFLLFLGK